MGPRRKFALSLGALLCVGCVFAAWLAVLLPLADWAERHANAYPYKGGEDALRYVLCATHRQPGAGRLLWMGSSNAGEALLSDMLELELQPFRVTIGAVSMARLTETRVLLEYIERVYGAQALPEVVALGASPRLVSNIPWDEPSRAFHAIDSYSSAFRVESSPETGSHLVAKTGFEGWQARWRGFAKQQPRLRAAMALWLLDATGYRRPYLDFPDRRGVRALNYTIVPSDRAESFPEEPRQAAAYLSRVGPIHATAEFLRFRFSPYLAHVHEPHPREKVQRLVTGSHTWWKDLRVWKPAEDRLARRELAELAEFAAERGIDLYVIALPDRPDVVTVYEDDLHREYLRLLEAAFGDRFLDLSNLLPVEDFNDSEHTGLTGAILVTQRIGAFIADRRAGAVR